MHLPFLLISATISYAQCEAWLIPKFLPGVGSFVVGARPNLRTPRLLLRTIEDYSTQHRRDHRELFADDLVQKDIRRAGGISLKQWDSSLSTGVRLELASELEILRLELGIIERVSGRLIGQISLTNFTYSGDIEFGYMIHPKFRGQGFAAEAAKALIAAAEEVLGKRRFYGWVAKDNSSSAKVMRKIGFERQAFEDSNSDFYERP